MDKGWQGSGPRACTTPLRKALADSPLQQLSIIEERYVVLPPGVVVAQTAKLRFAGEFTKKQLREEAVVWVAAWPSRFGFGSLRTQMMC